MPVNNNKNNITTTTTTKMINNITTTTKMINNITTTSIEALTLGLVMLVACHCQTTL